ncbi:MAG TPA: FusB/FusC family EF-G-binding protein [Bacilli bacterium]|nr:FusB/FusC family EF-G-binding protein [Bacilli bacterium]
MTHQPFIQPYQVNLIRHQLNLLIGSFYFAGDSRVLDASRANVMATILDQFTGLTLTAEQRALLEEAEHVTDKDEQKRYLNKLAPYVIPFPTITAEQIRKLFPKVKKLVLPDLTDIDYSALTYLGWRDIGRNSLYMVHHIDGKWVGTEWRYVSGQKGRAYQCSWCHRAFGGDDVALLTTQLKLRNVPDGYKVTGNHICLNSALCNHHLTSTDDMYALLAKVK